MIKRILADTDGMCLKGAFISFYFLKQSFFKANSYFYYFCYVIFFFEDGHKGLKIVPGKSVDITPQLCGLRSPEE